MPARRGSLLGRSVQTLTVDLHMIAKQAKQTVQDVDRLESAKTFVSLSWKRSRSRGPAAEAC